MATTRIKDLSKTATTVASDANIVIDGSSNGTQKITRDNFRQDTADAYVAAPSTYKLAPLNGVNKIDGTYLPTSGDTPKGEWNASTNSPTLADGTGTAGDYYDVTTAGTANLGSGAITYTVGDVVKYNGATWFKIDSVANILDGISTVDPAKSLLQIPNVGTAANEVPVNGMLGDLAFQSSAGVVVDDLTVDGHFTGTVGKPMPVNGPTMRFDGSNDFIDFAAPVGSAFDFTNGTDDLPLTAAGWLYVEEAGETQYVLGKWGTGSSTQHWLLATGTSGQLRFLLKHGATSAVAETGPVFESGKWYHVCATYAGSGPNSTHPFTQAASHAVALYVNGKPLAVSAIGSNNTGMTTSAQQVRIMLASNTYTEGQIRDVKLFNKELSAAEVKEVYSNGQLPESFAESTGGAWGGLESSDFSSGDDGYATNSGTVTGNTDGVLGVDDTLIHTDPASGTVLAYVHKPLVTVPAGKRVRHKFEYYIPAANTSFTTLSLWLGGSVKITNLTTTGSWATYDGEFVNSTGSDVTLRIYGGTGSSYTGAGESFYLKNIATTQIGSVLDARAEQFDTSTGKLYDLSGNSFVGTQSGGVSLLGREFPVYETGSFTPTVEFGGASSGTYSVQEAGYRRIGNTVSVWGQINHSSKSAATGSATIEGLPFSSAASSNTPFAGVVGMFNAANLTSQVVCLIVGSSTSLGLYDNGATGTTALDDTNFGSGTIIRFSITYQIS